MIDHDLQRLAARDNLQLDRLTNDIWRRAAEADAQRRTSRQVTGWQAAIMLVAVVSSAGVGASKAVTHREQSLFEQNSISPSNLLLGERQ